VLEAHRAQDRMYCRACVVVEMVAAGGRQHLGHHGEHMFYMTSATRKPYSTRMQYYSTKGPAVRAMCAMVGRRSLRPAHPRYG